MKQADLGLNLTTKRTRKREFLDEMERVVPWQALVDLITPFAPDGKRGRPPFPVETMLRVHFMQQWWPLLEMFLRALQGGMPGLSYHLGHPLLLQPPASWDGAQTCPGDERRNRRLLELWG